jgi:hypothetical protein
MVNFLVKTATSFSKMKKSDSNFRSHSVTYLYRVIQIGIRAPISFLFKKKV